MGMPSASTTSALPQRLETERLPCLATATPHAATTTAAALDRFSVCAPSPPVPQVSTTTAQAVLHRGHRRAHRLGGRHDRLRALAAHPQRHRERADLHRRPRAREDRVERGAHVRRVDLGLAEQPREQPGELARRRS